jgi:hypothetical protein
MPVDDPTSTPPTVDASMAFDMKNPRSINDAYSMGASYSREQRKKLSADGKAKFIKTATESIEKKFDLVDNKITSDEKFLEQHYDFMILVERLRDKMNIHGVSDVFALPNSLKKGKPPDMTSTTDLLKNYSGIDRGVVCAWSEFIYTYADEITIENMHLSQNLILNSCELELYKKVSDELCLMPPEHKGGPMAFFLMAKHIVATTDKAARAIVQRLQRVKLTSFPNEDVTRFSAVVTSIASRLKSAGKLPDDMDEIVYEGLTNTTVYAFRTYLNILYTTESPKMKDYTKMMDTATIKFNEMNVEDKWLPKNKAGSSFQAQTGPAGPTAHPEANYNNSDTTYTPKPIDRTPPQPGEAATRTTDNNREEHWCGKCREGGRWGNHGDAGHDAFVTKMKERNAQRKERQQQARLAVTTPTPSTTTAPDDTATEAPPPDRLRPAGRNSHTVVTNVRRIGTYHTANF